MNSEFVSRRSFMKKLGVMAGASVSIPFMKEAVGAVCGLTPAQTEGPFYPVKDQLDKDNDLTQVKGRSGKAKGQVVYVMGQVKDENCNPVQSVLVEIWQACASGRYNHAGDPNPAELDLNFQYWGRSISDEKGNYLFKTIVPGHYPASNTWIRPPHIHVKVGRRGFHELTTQMYFEGNPYNETDRILVAIPKEERSRVVIRMEDPSQEFEPDSKICRFDISINSVK